jgi:hypothetical protein
MTDVNERVRDAGADSQAAARRRSVPAWFLLGVLLTQTVWILSVPPFRGVDEIDHVYRAASVALGQIRPTQLPADGRGALVEVPPGIVADAQAQCRALVYNGTSNCTPEETLPDGDVMVASSAASYSPVAYAAIGIVARPWHGAAADYAMRAAASIFNGVLLVLAAWCLTTRSRTAWPMIGLVVGLTPMAIFTSILPAPNGLELSAAAVLWCALLALPRAAARFHSRLFASAALAAVILGSVRETGPLFILLIVAFAGSAAPRETLALVRRRWRWGAAVASVALVAALYQVHWILNHPPVKGNDEGRPFDIPVILGQVVLWVFQWMGAFPFRGQPASPVTYLACGIAFVVVFAQGFRRGDARRWVALGVVVTCLVLPLIFALATFTEKGTFWQGRYALPLLLGAPLLIGFSLDDLERDSRVARWTVIVTGAVATAAAAIHLAHAELARPASANDPHWHRPAWYAVLLLTALAAAAFGKAMAGRDPESRQVPDEASARRG